MKNARHFKKWEGQARQFFGDDFWEDILSVLPDQEGPTESDGETAPPPNRDNRGMPMRPAVDLYRTERQFIVHLELPGLPSIKSVDVYLQNGELVISGTLARQYGDQQAVIAERFIGDFKRVIPLPEPVDEDGISAQYRNGLLMVVLPRRRKKQAKKRIQIALDP